VPALFVALVVLTWSRNGSVRWIPIVTGVLGATLLINAPHYWRNWQLSGSPLGYDSPFGNADFTFKNEQFGWKSTFSNVLRHTSEQLGTRNPRWNQAVYSSVVDIHRAFGIDPQDPGATWQWSRYSPPENTRHESNANNRWRLLVLCAGLVFSVGLLWKRRDPQWLIYGTALVAAFLLFCFYLRWQPYGARLFVPLFLLGSPLAGRLLDTNTTQDAVACCVCVSVG
jgi:hypothetical protein